MAYTKYSLTPSSNNAAPPDGAPEGMLPSAVNDIMRDMMAQIRDCGDGIRGGTYTMTAPVITGGSINGTTTITTSGAISYTGTLTGGTGVVNLGSGQFYKDASGNVGIGTSSPSTGTLNRQLTINSGASSLAGIVFQNNATGTGAGNGTYITTIGTDFAVMNQQTGYVSFGTTGTERMRITSAGDVLVGLTATSGSPAVGYIFNSNGFLQIARASGAAQSTVGFYNGGSFVGEIQTSTVATLYVTTSDYRLKTVIAPVTDAGQRLDALQPIEYDWKNGVRSKGFLAHQFAEVYPNSVSGEKDAVDAEGKPKYQGMQASSPEVMADLIAEIQSLRKRVAQLESK
jgi:hypothetical protein